MADGCKILQDIVNICRRGFNVFELLADILAADLTGSTH